MSVGSGRPGSRLGSHADGPGNPGRPGDRERRDAGPGRPGAPGHAASSDAASSDAAPRDAAPRDAAPRDAAPNDLERSRAGGSADSAGTAALTVRSRWLALVVLCSGMLMVILDGTIVAAALPVIQADLGFSPSSLAWVVNAYLIPFGGLLLLSGRLGDLVGRRQLFLVGVVIFTLASIWCGFAGTPELLIAARFVQGVGGALTAAVILGMIAMMFPEPGERARAIGLYSFVGAAGASIGLLLGGVLTDAVSWHWIFFVNAPFGLAVVILAVVLIRADRGIGLAAGADVPGAVLVTAGLMLGVYTIVGAEDTAAWATAGLGALSVFLLVGFVVRQSMISRPLVPLRIFRSRNVSGANAVQVLTMAGMLGFQFVSVLYLQNVLGYRPALAGIALLPIPVVIGVFSLAISGRLIGRFGGRATLAAGMALLAIGLGWLSQVPVNAEYAVDVLPSFLLLGVGAGLTLPAVTTLAMSGATEHDSGLASGLANTTQQVGGALGVAVLATVAAARTTELRADGGAAREALAGGYHTAFTVSAGLVVVGLGLVLAVLRRGRGAAEPATGPGGAVRTA